MELRDASMSSGQPASPDSVEWRVPRGRVVLEIVGAVLVVASGLLFTDRLGFWLALLAGAGLAAAAARDLLAPVRLAADRAGVTVVVGFAGRRQLAWSEIDRVRVDARQRLGLRSELVEIDAGDSLHLFGSGELGAPVADVVEELTRLAPTSARASWSREDESGGDESGGDGEDHRE